MTDLRAAALARSVARATVEEILTFDEMCNHDVQGIVTDLVERGLNMHDMGTTELAGFIAPHEYDEDGMTDAQYAAAKALAELSQTGWIAMIRTGDDVQMMDLNLRPELDTPAEVEAHLREFVNYPAGTQIMILPKVG